MKRLLPLLMLITMLVLSIAPTIAQSNTADIVSFTTSFTSIGRDALTNRTARIPVTWITVNRPLSANLFFEQVLPDGSTINVELPRLIPYVASSGDGIAAPILPATNANSIRLRVTLKEYFTSTVYDTAEIVLPIVNGNGGGSGGGESAAITSFYSPTDNVVNRSELEAGTARIPVTWSAINRPITANLVFEQVLANGTVVNVELPRDFIWVNSSDNGMVAPIVPGGNATSITLRLRLVDLVFNRTYDVRYYYIPIQEEDAQPDPIFTLFSPVHPQINRSEVEAGDARISVLWSLAHRPPNTNLIFEQVLPNGTVRNAELPRDFIVVPSSGSGIVTAVLPDTDVTELSYRLRLVNMQNQATLLTTTMSVALVDDTTSPSDPVQFTDLYVSPVYVYSENIDTENVYIVWETNNATNINIIAENTSVDIPATISGEYPIPVRDVEFEGDFFQIVVTASDGADNTVSRTLTVSIVGDNDPATTTVSSFTANPTTVEAGSDVTLSWDIDGSFENAQMYLIPVDGNGRGYLQIHSFVSEGEGSVVWTVPDGLSGERTISLYVNTTPTSRITQNLVLDIIPNQDEECTYEWAFTVDTTACPSAPLAADGAYQLFDRGFMVWNTNRTNQPMLVFYNDGTMVSYDDNWNGQDFVIDGTPPEGKYAPERGFGYLWSNEPLVRSSLGWGAAPEVTHRVTQQNLFDDASTTYMTLPDGRVVRFGNGQWELIN